MNRTIALFGIPGVGKSYTAATISGSLGIKACSASQLLMTGREISKLNYVSQDRLRNESIKENQNNILLGYNKLRENYSGSLILDCHTVIDKGDIVERIPACIFSGLDVVAFISLQEDPSIIYNRRVLDTARERPMRSEDELRKLQELSVKAGEDISAELGIPLLNVDGKSPNDWYEKLLADFLK